jgi:hypothetical protein
MQVFLHDPIPADPFLTDVKLGLKKI